MNPTALNQINDKLKFLSDDFAEDIIEYLDLLNNTSNLNNEFVLSAKQIEILDNRSKSPIENFISADKAIADLKIKYGV
jgi:hypothetical protein